MSIFKAYDIRGIYGDELTDELAYRIGRALVTHLGCSRVVVGRDMRVSSPALFSALCEGITDQGADVLDIGLVCSDATYFASGSLNLPAVMITASHNPANYNGMKFSRAGCLPLNLSSGLDKVRDLALTGSFAEAPKGKIITQDTLGDYLDQVTSFVDRRSLKPIKIAADAGNAMAGAILPLLCKSLPFELIPLYFELDGTFPNHPAHPQQRKNLKDLQHIVVEQGCAMGIAFDGDADRVFFVDEQGQIVDSSLIASLINTRLLETHPGSTMVHCLVSSKIVSESIESHGGKAIEERVGHSFIKKTMRAHDALFGSENSGHYYYRDHYFADSAMITWLLVAEILSTTDKPLSALLAPFAKYAKIEETNFEVEDKQAMIDKLHAHFEQLDPQGIHTKDGLTVRFAEWWFNVRPSNTEPLLRLNLEADTKELMQKKSEELTTLITS